MKNTNKVVKKMNKISWHPVGDKLTIYYKNLPVIIKSFIKMIYHLLVVIKLRLLFRMQKQTPRDARTRQRTETRMEREALKPRPVSTLARPPRGRGAAPRLSSVTKW